MKLTVCAKKTSTFTSLRPGDLFTHDGDEVYVKLAQAVTVKHATPERNCVRLRDGSPMYTVESSIIEPLSPGTTITFGDSECD